MNRRRTFSDVDAHARAHERVGVQMHAAAHCERIDAAEARGDIDTATAALSRQHVRAFAQEIATGLHVGDHNSIATRRVTRMMLKEAGFLPADKNRESMNGQG